MEAEENELIPTRASLLLRLRDWQDQASWLDFFNIYWRLIYAYARKGGLNDVEAQDVVQETLLAVAKNMSTFNFDPKVGSFKGWLFNTTRWKIMDQFRRRQKNVNQHRDDAGDSTVNAAMQNLVDPNAKDMDGYWEQEWEKNLLAAAMSNLKTRIDPERFQIFDCYVTRELSAEKVAQRFSVSVDQVYQIKHRMTDALREEVERLKKEMV